MSSSSDSDAQDSDSSYETKLKRKMCRNTAKAAEQTDKKGQKKYECKGCSKVFRSLASRFVHTSKCQAYQKKKTEQFCSSCNKYFPSKSERGLHALEVHGDNSHEAVNADTLSLRLDDKTCHSCKTVFKNKSQLQYHIRKTHFNLIGKVPYAEEKKVNQVWFEKVMNSDNIVEIKKTKHNMLVMKKMNENTAIKVNFDNVRIIDVSTQYPTGRGDCRVRCQYCNKMLAKSRFRKHYKEVHLNIRNHLCNICNKTFKRKYQLVKHPCYEEQQLKDEQESTDIINDTSIESL